jgi:hypothetical protein
LELSIKDVHKILVSFNCILPASAKFGVLLIFVYCFEIFSLKFVLVAFMQLKFKLKIKLAIIDYNLTFVKLSILGMAKTMGPLVERISLE